MEAVNLIVDLFSFILGMANSFLSFCFGNWVMSLFFAGCIILFILNLVIISSKDESNK